MSLMLTRRAGILSKVEVTYGTDAEPVSATNAILCSRIEPSENLEFLNRANYRSSIGIQTPVIGRKEFQCAIECELKGSGTAGTAPEYGPLLRACGLEETIVPATSVTYTPISDPDDLKSVTIYAGKDQYIHKGLGCMGNLQLTLNAGEIPMLTFSMQGKSGGTPAAGGPISGTVSAEVPIPVKSASFTFGGYAFTNASLTLDLGNTVGRRDDINDATSVKGYIVTGRAPKGTIDVEVPTPADQQVWSRMFALTENALSVVVGSGAGSIITITAGHCIVTGITYGDRNGILTASMEFSCTQVDSDNDDLSIAFT